MVEAEYAEVFIKGKYMIDAVCVDQCKTGAIGEAQAWKVVFAENVFGFFTYYLVSKQHGYAGVFKGIHVGHCGAVT